MSGASDWSTGVSAGGVPWVGNFAGGFEGEEAKAAGRWVVCVHGFGTGKGGSKITRIMTELRGRGVGAIAIDLAGHGENGRELTIENCVEDIAGAVEMLQGKLNERGERRPIGLYGSSFGGFCVLCYLCNRREADMGRVMLVAPAVCMAKNFEPYENKMKNGIFITPKLVESVRRYDVLGSARRLRGLDIVYGENDTAVDNGDIFELFKRAKWCNLYKIEGAEHWFAGKGELDQIVDIAMHAFAD